MADISDTLQANGWKKEYTGGNCYALRKGALVMTGIDGDLPSDGWWILTLTPDWDNCGESVADCSDCSLDDGSDPRDYAADIAMFERLETVWKEHGSSKARANITFQEFQAAGRDCDCLEFETDDSELKGVAGRIYPGLLYLIKTGTDYSLTIDDVGRTDSRLEMEMDLYFWALAKGYWA